MFKQAYQNGKYFQLLSIQDKETIKNWGLIGNLKKAYDRTVKGYIFVSDSNSKL